MTDYLCNLILPGAAKSGTSSLHNALAQHPDICMSRPKEPQFFSFDDAFGKGADFHNRLFSHATGDVHFYGEGSQSYFVHEHAKRRIAESLQDARIIIMLREPLDRLISHYRWNVKRGSERERLGEALRSRGESTEYVYDHSIRMYRELGGYLAFSRYTQWVPMWFEGFGRDNVLLLFFEDFVQDQERVLSECFSFLGIGDLQVAKSAHANKTQDTVPVSGVIPSLLKLAGRATPSAFKGNRLYTSVRKSIRRAGMRAASRQSEKLLASVDEDTLCSAKADLGVDIEYYESLKMRHGLLA